MKNVFITEGLIMTNKEQLISILKNGASNEEIWKLLKLMFNSMKDCTYYSLLKNDTEYQNILTQMENAEITLNTLGTTPETQNFIDRFFACNDEMYEQSVCNAYLAGIIDGFRILRGFNLILE